MAEELWVDSKVHDGPNSAATSTTVLQAGVDYSIVVDGNWTAWNGGGETSSPYNVKYLSSGQPAEKASFDADVTFGSWDKPGIYHGGGLQWRLAPGDPWIHIEPEGGPFSTVQGEHVYHYVVPGKGHPVSFGVGDSGALSDNNGQFKVTIDVLGGAQTIQGGPIILAEIDAEDHGQDWSGPLTYICNNVTKHNRTTGLSLLVLGATGGSQNWFQNLANTTNRFTTVNFVVGTAIQTVDFTPYDVIGLPSNDAQTSGGITSAGQGYVNGRADAFTEHINAGGGLLAFSWEGSSNPYMYLGGVASFGVNYYLYDTITPTQAGLDIGITTALNVYAWHGVFTSWPDFMNILAYDEGTTSPAALGGAKVIVREGVDSPLRVRGRDDPNTYGTPRVTLGGTQVTSHQYSQRVRLGGSVYS